MKISYNPSDVCSRSYKAFSVLYDLRNKQIIQLEAVSADIWNYIVNKNCTTIDDIVSYISSLYDYPKNALADDIIDFLQDLYDSGIIQFNGSYCPVDINIQPVMDNSISDNEDFEGQIIGCLESENQLYSATIEMTYACNETCIHCYAHYPTVDTSSDHLSISQYQVFIDELYELGALHIAFTGGDPFMNKNFLKIFEYSRNKGFVADIFTNGLWLAEHPLELEKVLTLHPRAFYISLYGASSTIHDSITGVPGSFSKTVDVIRKIHAANIPVVLNIMLLAENHSDLQRIITLANSLNVEYRVSMSLIYRNDGSASPMDHFIGDKEKVKSVLRTIRGKIYSVDKPVNSEPPENSSYMCRAGVTSICLSPDGTIYPCVSLKTPLGSIKTSTVSKIWNSSKRLSLVESLKWENTKECVSCPYKSNCPHCIGMSQAETGDMFSCNTCDKMISECIAEL